MEQGAVNVDDATTSRSLGDSSPSTSASVRTIAYQPALDGVRALAVAAVLLFHAEVPGFGGGYLGVSVFFTLSGYLITSLLAAEVDRDGSIALGAFYARRARRLIPASLLVVLLVVFATVVTDWFDGVDSLRAQAIGSLLQVANWVFLAGEGSYQELLEQSAGAVSPLEHYWSLAIEEQFYWLWPIAFIGLWKLGRSARGRLVAVGGVTAVAVIAAPVIAAIWGADAAYWSTPARAAEILIGAFAALVLRGRLVDRRWWVLAPVALAVLAVCIVTFPTAGGPAYAGALPAIGLVSVALIIGLQAPSRVRDGVAAAPLVWLGTVSYGVYLFHWPLFVVLSEDRLGVDGPLLLITRLVATLVVAQLSFVLFERPIRHGLQVSPRAALGVAGAATLGAVGIAAVVVPGPRGAYWELDDAETDAAAIVVDDTPLDVTPLVTEPAVVDAVEGPADVADEPVTSEAAATALAEDLADQSAEPVAGEPVPVEPVPGEPVPGETAEAVPPTTEVPLPTPSRPVRMLIAGDSTAVATGAGIVRWAADEPDLAQIEVHAAPGCGFLRGGDSFVNGRWVPYEEGCTTYMFELTPARAAEVAADLAVMMTTSWDVFDRRWDDGEVVAPPEFLDRLLTDFTDATQRMLDAGVGRVVWVEMPMPDPQWNPFRNVQEEPERHAALHETMATLAERFGDRVSVLDFDGWFTEAGLDDDQDARPDGVHLTPERATELTIEWLGERLLRAALL